MQKPTPQELADTFEQIANVNHEELQYLIDESELKTIKKGDMVLQPEQKADEMILILSGRVRAYRVQQGQNRELGILEKGVISGLLPYSRMESTRANGIALEDGAYLSFHRSKMPDLIKNHYSLT